MFDIKADAVIKPEIEQIQIRRNHHATNCVGTNWNFLLSFIAYVITKKKYNLK